MRALLPRISAVAESIRSALGSSRCGGLEMDYSLLLIALLMAAIAAAASFVK